MKLLTLWAIVLLALVPSVALGSNSVYLELSNAKPVAPEVQDIFDRASNYLNSIGIPAERLPVYYGKSIQNNEAETHTDSILIDVKNYRRFLIEADRIRTGRRGFSSVVHHLVLHEILHSVHAAKVNRSNNRELFHLGARLEEGLVESFTRDIWQHYTLRVYGQEAWKFAKFRLYFTVYEFEVRYVRAWSKIRSGCKVHSKCAFQWRTNRLLEPYQTRFKSIPPI